jgi:hypothetical protein
MARYRKKPVVIEAPPKTTKKQTKSEKKLQREQARSRKGK